MSAAPRVYSPADVRAARVPFTLKDQPRCAVGGRVVFCDGSALRIADAFAALDVQLRHPLALEMGSLVQVEGVLEPASAGRAAALNDARVQSTHPGQYRSNGDFARFTRSAQLLQQRQLATQAVRNHFSAQGFLEVETPTRVLAPGTDVYLDPIPSGSRWLITSPEFHLKRLLVAGVPRVFELARCFRADEVGPWHQPQFTLLEWYRAFEDYNAVMRDTEALVACVAQVVTAGAAVQVGKYLVNLTTPFEQLSTRTVFQRYANVPDVAALALADETRYFEHWVNDVEPALAELGRPVFVTEFPLSQAALARPCAADPNYAERFELFAGGVELCNGYGELTCALTQEQRFQQDVARRAQLGRPSLPVDNAFLQALHEGMPRASGNALGFERLLALLLERPLSDVIAFPEAF